MDWPHNSINHIIYQTFIIYKREVFRQCIGMPMGTNCAPDMANLFLHHYEQNYIDHLIQTDHTQFAQALANMFRYQDDLIVFNDDDYFGGRYTQRRKLALITIVPFST